MILFLDYDKARSKGLLIDYKKFMDEHVVGKYHYSMARGTPILVNVDGSYIKLTDVVTLCNRKILAEKYVNSIYRQEPREEVTLHWSRKTNI